MKLLRGLLALYCIEGLLAVLWIFLTPSESGRALLLWLSTERLALFILAILLWAAVLGVSFAVWRSTELARSLLARLDRFCIEEKGLGALLITFSVLPLLVLAAVLKVVITPPAYAAYKVWAPDTFPLLHSIVLALLPFLVFFIVASLEFTAFLALRYRHSLAAPGIWALRKIGPALLLLFAAAWTAGYWLVLLFRLRFFVNDPAWYWKFEPVAFQSGDAVFAVLSLALLALAYWTLIARRKAAIGLASLFLLLLFLQFSVGLMSGGGLAAFRDRYFSTYHKTYLSKAAQGSVSVLQSIRVYEQLYGSGSFTSTKPPGLMAFYGGLDHLLNGYPSAYPVEIRYDRLSWLVTYLFPLLAALLPVAVYAFARRFAPGRLDLVPPLAPFILVLCPSLILFSLFPDQAIYPLLFLLGTSLIVTTINRQSILLAFLLGVFLYLAVFFAFTMLPLYPFALLYLAVSYWADRPERPLQRQLLLAAALAGGTLIAYFAFRFLLNYDFLPRFAKTVSINHDFDFYLRVGHQPPTSPDSFPTRLGQILGAAWLNNLDFAAAAGFPVYILFIVQAFRQLTRLVQGHPGPDGQVMSALLLSFVLLNLAGTAQGEVPRLWLFWLPMVVILAAYEVEKWAREHPSVVLGLAVAQLITLFLTFHFQDLHM